MVIRDKSYKERIGQEATFWDQFEKEANQCGIPWWCDLRRATKLGKMIGGWMHDPKIEEILRGHYKEKLIEVASNRKGAVLDLGCGAGWLSLELARRGANVDGYDISQERIRIAKDYLEKNSLREEFGSIDYQVRDINRLKLEEHKYDSIVAWDSLHHVPEIDRLMREIRKSMKANGMLIIYDHIGLESGNHLVIKLLRFPIRIWHSLNKPIGTEPQIRSEVLHADVKNILDPPFENVTGSDMIDAIQRYLQIVTLKTDLCFLGFCGNDLTKLPDALKFWLLRVLKLIDVLFIKMGILRGEYVFIIAKKEEIK